MNTATIARETETDALLRANPDITVGFSARWGSNEFQASGYWPNDVVRGQHYMGKGATIESAIADVLLKIEAAKNAAPVLKTAAECKDAVIALIREHDAAPASFRDAVDALPVASR